MIAEIFNAIEEKNLIEFYYDDEYRLIEPYTYGISKKGNELLRGYQIEGGTVNGKVPAWRLFTVEKIENMRVRNETYNNIREGYKRGDSAMNYIYKEL